MRILLAVIDDLYNFTVHNISALFNSFGTRARTPQQTPLEKDVAVSQKVFDEVIYDDADAPDASSDAAETEAAPHTFRSVDAIIEEKKIDTRAHEPERSDVVSAAYVHAQGTLMYISAAKTRIYLHPTKAFDTVLTEVPYGTMVLVLAQQGQWCKILAGEITGWVRRDECAERAADVFPAFEIGEKNEAESPNTLKVRGSISDMFNGTVVDMPLQSVEYVQYKLLRKGLTINWPQTRPRTPGAWHTILKGVSGVHIGIIPKTGAVMEYMLTEFMGHVAYVEAVFPDETITITEVNYPDSGIYNERVLTMEEWRELHPVFIQVL